MEIYHSLVWMFFGSIFIGLFLNGMNMLAYRFSDLYFSRTLFYSALLMASNMCILEILMFYGHSGIFGIKFILPFIVLSILLVILLRTQFMVTNKEWLKRMISHHSTALTTSHQILKKTKNEITNLSISLKPYIHEVLRKASINKASKIHEHGISLGQTANLLGITQWELSEYVGRKEITDRKYSQTINTRVRAKMAMEFFR